MPIHLDYETFSNLDVTEVGAYRYAEDPSTEILICCYAFDDGPVQTWLPWKDKQCPPELAARVARGAMLCAHNSQFERAIWQYIMVKRHGAPPTKPSQWVCTAVLAAQAGVPRSLDGATMALNMPHKKDPEGERLKKVFTRPQKPTKKNNQTTRIRPLDQREEFKQFISYCHSDVEAERGLYHELPPLDPWDRRIFILDTVVNERGLPVDMDMVRKARPVVGELVERAAVQCREITGLNPTQVQKLKHWLNTDGGLDLPNLQRQTLENVIIHPDTPDHIATLLEIRLEAALVSHKKFDAMLRVCSPTDGRARGTIMFYGAHTGRWSGKLIQPHNFKRGNWANKKSQALDYELVFKALEWGDPDVLQMVWENPILAVSMVMRGFIKVQEGKTLRVVDYAAIEARILAWIAGEQWLIDAFNRGFDVYKMMAAFLFHVAYEDVSPEQRRIAKNLVLGCGYQLGWRKFIEYCARQGLYITEEQSKEGVGGYREKNKRIVNLWYDVERAAIAAVQKGVRVPCGYLAFEMQGRWLTMILPSGRRLYYLDPKVQATIAFGKPKLQLTFKEEYNGTMVRASTYGGKLVENAVQGIARDLMANGMEKAEEHEYEIIGTVHDELLNEGEEGDGRSVKDLEHVVCILPPWAKGCPIGAEGFETVRYRKG